MVELRLNSSGSMIENTLYFDRGQAHTTQEVQTLAALIANWWYNVMRPLQRNTVVHREVYVTTLTVQDGYTYSDTSRFNQVGGVTGGTSHPNNVTYALTFKTAQRGRAYRGRNYVIGLGSSHSSGDFIISTVRNNWIACYNALMPGGSYDPTPWRWIVLSKYLNGELRENAAKTPVTSVSAFDDRLDSQRRRLREA